jgi:para-aminobenzoate synthetase component I
VDSVIVPVPSLSGATPQQVYACLKERVGTVLLESSKIMPGLSSWSWVTGPALATLQTLANEPTVLQQIALTGEKQGSVMGTWPDPFQALHEVLVRLAKSTQPDVSDRPHSLSFCAGLVGYLGYDLARHIERLPTHALPDPDWPWMQLHVCDHVLAFHHAQAQWYFCTHDLCTPDGAGFTAPNRAEIWRQTLALATQAHDKNLNAAHTFKISPLVPRTGATQYQQQVQEALNCIAAGDIFQANLSHRFEADFEGDAFALYTALTQCNPAPFSAYMQSRIPGQAQGPTQGHTERHNFALASVSPERFLKLEPTGKVVARPIKGTLPRHPLAAQDQIQRQALASSEKDKAENLMIVDLMRNDLGRVAQTGSVQVTALFELEAHPSVWQMVSTIQAQLQPHCNGADLLRACWPPGSMTGAPKVQAMAIIDALEPVQRGPYAGAIGYFDINGGLDLSVIIRTAMVYQQRVMLQVGGGVVADSRPTAEWDETLAKGRLLMQVLQAK